MEAVMKRKARGVYQRPNSPFWYIRFNYKGKKLRWSTGENTMTAAENYRADIKRSIRDGTFEEKYLKIQQDAFKLSAGIEWYLSNYVSQRIVAEKNRKDTKRILGDFLKVIGDKPFMDIRRSDIENYKEARLRIGNSTESINRQLGTISGMFTRLARKDIVPSNPIQGKLEYYPEKRAEKRYATPEEIQMILASVDNSEFKMIILVSLFTGMRLSNVTGLRMENIDFKRGCFQFYQVKVRPGEQPVHNIVPIGRVIEPILKKYVEKFGITDYLFKFKSQTITNMWIAKMKELGIKKLKFKNLRQTLATYLLNNSNADIFMIASILGHKKPFITDQVYASTEVKKKRAAIDETFGSFEDLAFLKDVDI